MLAVSASLEHRKASAFRDGLGDRFVTIDAATGELVQELHLPRTLTDSPGFEFTLRERLTRLSTFRHASYARAYRIERTDTPEIGLALVSEHVEGIRLSDLLRVADERRVDIDISTALSVIRQLLPATAALQAHAPDVVNGVLAPERLIVTPRGRIALVEQVLGAALERLPYHPARFWRDLRIGLRPASAQVRFTHRVDVLNTALIALSLILGRPLRDDEFPERIPALIEDARERSALGYERRLSPPLRAWLARALQLEPDRAYGSTSEAWREFETIVTADPLYLSTPITLEIFLYKCTAALISPSAVHAEPAAVTPDQPGAPAPVIRDSDPAPALEPAALGEPEIQVQMLPPCHVASEVASAGTQYDAIDWSAAAEEGTAVATAQDITQLFTDAGTPSTGAEEPAIGAPALLPVPDAVAETRDDTPQTASAHAQQPAADTPVAIQPAPARRRPNRLFVAAAVLGLLAIGGAATRVAGPTVRAASRVGTLAIETNPAGLPVFIDGVEQGQTPARLTVPAGEHVLEVRGPGAARQVPFTLAAGGEYSQYFEFSTAPETGSLRVESDPPGATVIVDSLTRGTTPLTVKGLSPGVRNVVLQTSAGAKQHAVAIEAGVTASLKLPAEAPRAAFGWLTINSAFPVSIRVGGRNVGSSSTERIRMAAGSHEVELVNETEGYRLFRVVHVAAGKVTSLRADRPATGVVNLNASPWAEVWIGGRRIGETPLANVTVPVGQHEVVFRHPRFGEKRQEIAVTPGTPLRLSVEMQ